MNCLKHILLIIEAQVVTQKNTEINKTRADLIKNVLTKLKRMIKNTPKDDAAKIEENENITDVVEKILEINNKIQSVQGLKLLTPGLMLGRLPISLAQLNAGNNSKKLKNEIIQLSYSLYRSKKLQKISIKVWFTLFKYGNNLYEH